MSNKVDAALYWSVQRKKDELISEIEKLKRNKYIIPKDHILIDDIEHRLDLSDGHFYTKESFQHIYCSKSSELWELSGSILKTIINELNEYS